MSGFQVQGWCPGALRPMPSGDGLVVRVRPALGRLTGAQARGLAAAAGAFGNGWIELSARGNVQLRGVSEAGHPGLIGALSALGLIDPDAEAERRRNILVTPFVDAATLALAAAVQGALAQMPALPAKFGFAVDTGPAPVLSAVTADIRLERSADGRLLVRCDGAALGAPVEDAAAAVVALARWFVAAGGVSGGRGRMARLIARGAVPSGALAGRIAPAVPAPAPAPGLRPEGALVAVAFGRMRAGTLAALGALGPLRVTPWRMLLIEGATRLPALPEVIGDPADPILRVAACPGAPDCLQGLAPVRTLARRLAPGVPAGRVLHVSGCAKGCAHPGAADVTLVATGAGFDLIRDGAPGAPPTQRGLSAATLDPKDLF